MSRPAVSAIVVSYHTGARLKECLFGLLADPDVSEIVIVDNGNPDEMQDWIGAFVSAHPSAKLITGHGNIGFGAAANKAVVHAAGPHLLIINPDAVLRWNSLAGMQAVAERCAVPWIIGGKIFGVHGHEERGGRRKELTLMRAATRLVGWNTWTLEHTPAPAEPVDMPVISGAFFLTSKDSWARLDGFDEGYFLHVEDVDLCRRCREAGGRVVYDPRAGALHYGSTSDMPSKTVQAHKADSLGHYFRKFSRSWPERLLVALIMPVIRIGTQLRRP